MDMPSTIFFCSLVLLLQLSYTSTYANELQIFNVGGKDMIVPCLTILISYGFIPSSMYKHQLH
jgi:olfactory receptor